MKRAWIAALLFLAGCQTERLAPGEPVTLDDAQVAAVQDAVRAELRSGAAAVRFSLLRAADGGSGRTLVCGVFATRTAEAVDPQPLPFRAALGPEGAATVLDIGGSRYRNEVIAARCGRSGISTQNLIMLR